MTRQKWPVKGKGFSLIEAMVALAILSFGLLAVANFQISLVSGSAYNKARAEATALAQQKLDELRNYATEPELVANLENAAITDTDRFPDDVTAGDYPQKSGGAVDPTIIDGTNAQFKRQWTVSGTGDLRKVVVTVSWSDPKEGTQSVSLETEVTWKNTRGMADLGNNSEPAVPNPTGRATLGDGTATKNEIDPTKNSKAHDNGDGTTTLDRNGDRVLVDNTTADADGNYQVVLTLQKACLTESGVCQDFVKISGRIFIDQEPTGPLTSDAIQVLASDAAYCARGPTLDTDNYIDTDGDGTVDTRYGDGDDTTDPDYKYFDYTCYLGGGWYGNIGLLFSGANKNDYACVGSPGDNSAAADTWKNVELAKRRVYRGLTYLESDWDSVTGTASRYWSKGIADETKLPDPNWAGHTHGHDFVVMRATGNTVSAGSCTAPLTRPDAVAVGMFDGAPGDFICLNADGDTTQHKYLDTLKTGHGAPEACPGNYDPSDPPSVHHTITGQITNVDSAPLTGLEVNTSDGPENCVVTYNGTTVDYVCNIYNWADESGTEIGWIGEIQFSNAPYPVVLDSYALSFASSPVTTDINPATVVYAHDKLSPYITGTITAPDNDLSFLTDAMVTTTDPYGTCQVIGLSDGTATYGCDVFGPDQNTGWTGTVTFAVPADYNCSTSSYEFTTPITTNSTVPEFTCTGPLRKYTLDGVVVSGVTPDPKTLKNSAITVTGGVSGSCTISQATNGKDVNYSCAVVIDTRTAGSTDVTVTITPPSDSVYWCGSGSAAYQTTVTADSDKTLATVTCITDPNDAVKIYGSVLIYYPSDTVWYNDSSESPWDGTWDGVTLPSPATDTPVPLTIEMIGSDGVRVDGTCSYSPPSLADAWYSKYSFVCTSNTGVVTYPNWSGSIRFSTGDPAPLWAQRCSPVGGDYAVTVTAGSSVTGADAEFDTIAWCP